jgi:hypothetical protein
MMNAFAQTGWWYVFIIGLVSIYMGLTALTTFKNNQLGGWWMFLAWSVNLLGPWFIISRYSPNLLRDGLIYDITVMVAFYGTLTYLAGRNLHPMQYGAIVWCIFGVFMFKWFDVK